MARRALQLRGQSAAISASSASVAPVHDFRDPRPATTTSSAPLSDVAPLRIQRATRLAVFGTTSDLDPAPMGSRHVAARTLGLPHRARRDMFGRLHERHHSIAEAFLAKPRSTSLIPVVERATVSIEQLKSATYNPRKISAEAKAGLSASVDRFGAVREVVVNRRNMTIVGGHQLVEKLRSSGVADVAVVYVDLDEKDEKALNVALNSSHITGEFTADLQSVLEEVQSLDEMLFAELRMGELLGKVMPLATEPPPPAGGSSTPSNPKTMPGDLYILGDHRLLCGDALIFDDVAKLLGHEKVDALVTDPLIEANSKESALPEEYATDYRLWFATWLPMIPWAEKSAFHVCIPSSELHYFRKAIDDCGLEWGTYLVWVKTAPIGRKDYGARHEFIVYGWADKHAFYGAKNATSVLEFESVAKADRTLPFAKPIGLFEQLVRDISAPGMIVLDLFAGSGTTLIACELHKRRARLMELSPAHCDVIVTRWEEFTGKKAVLAAAG